MPSSNRESWNVNASNLAKKTFNPIRNIIETMKIIPNPEKDMIALSIGDPTTFGNLKPSENVIEAVMDSVKSGKHNGYGPSTGFASARRAVAEHVSVPGCEIYEEDVILCSGCSCSLDLCISALGNPGQNILVPRPGFPLYKTLANGLGIETKEYNLIPEQEWQVDLIHLEELIDENTVAIVINNPSNPCGSVFTKKHLKDILAIAEKYHVPIIADEIYEYFVFAGRRYHPIASLTTTVPVLSCGGLTKRWLVPGWRLGWITIHDRNSILGQEVRKGLQSLSQRIIGANTLIQGALPAILTETPKEFYLSTIDLIHKNAQLAFKRLSAIPGLRPIMPSGAMYMMIRLDHTMFPEFENDLDIVSNLISEQSVFCLPGKCFNIPNYVRIVLTVPENLLNEACDRIAEFCKQHCVMSSSRKIGGEDSRNSIGADSAVDVSSMDGDLASAESSSSSEDSDDAGEDIELGVNYVFEKPHHPALMRPLRKSINARDA